jgi:uncharacterized Zn-binding protein involved in type VI secretion
MPKVTRIGDSFATGHGCTGTSTIAEGSGNVFANNISVSRKTDNSVPHTINQGPNCVMHVVPIVGGSGSVFVNNLRIARIGDAIDSGAITSGSPNVYAGD